MTPVYPSWDGNYGPGVMHHEHTTGELEGGTRTAEVAASWRAAQRAQWAHAHAARHGRWVKELENLTKAHRPGMRSSEARAARWGSEVPPATRAQPRVRSGEARPACRGKAPRRLRRELVERSEDGTARVPAREGQLLVVP